MGVQPTGIKITTAKKRYGSCNSRHSLCFSCYLMRCPEEAWIWWWCMSCATSGR